MDRTWKSKAAGIMTIISGCYGIGIGAFLATLGPSFSTAYPFLEPYLGDIDISGIPFDISVIGLLIGALGAAGITLGVIALIGGIFALKRRFWGLSLAGTIVSLPLIPVGVVLGILSIIFLVKGKREFA
jgi:hypothetical protein